MIKEFIEIYMSNKDKLKNLFKSKHPESYTEIIEACVSLFPEDYGFPSKERVHSVDDGSYSGVLVFVIGEHGYEPSDYWYVRVCYGSCSGCDTLEHIRGYSDEAPSDSQIDDYMTLCLHVFQSMKKMDDDTV